jgi:DNA polymerase III sliding clamp (beta) subunit (PCNA family)
MTKKTKVKAKAKAPKPPTVRPSKAGPSKVRAGPKAKVPETGGAQIDAAAFVRVTQAVQRVARSAPAHLRFVRYSVEEDHLVALAWSSGLWIRSTAPAGSESSVALAFALAIDTAVGIASIANSRMTVSIKEGKIHVAIPPAEFTFETPPNVDDTPPFPETADPKPAVGLPGAFRRVLPAVSREAADGVIAGIRVGARNCAATDNHRAHIVDVETVIEAVIPAALAEIIQGWPDASIGLSGSYVTASTETEAGDVEAAAYAVEGTFPNVESALPKETVGQLDAPPAVIEGALTALIKIGVARATRITIKATKTGCVFTSPSGTYPIECAVKGAWVGECAIDAEYLLDAVRAVGGETVSIAQAEDAFVVKGAGVRCVVAGMRTP